MALGYLWREVLELQRTVTHILSKSQAKEKPTATMGLYAPANENRQTENVIVPKTPQLIEWEANERTRKENLISRSLRQ